MNTQIYDTIVSKRISAAVLSSRGRDTTKIDNELTTLFNQYPQIYKDAEKEVKEFFGFTN